MSVCLAPDCATPTAYGHVFCSVHFQQLPGKLRSQIAMIRGVRRTPARDDLIARAISSLRERQS